MPARGQREGSGRFLSTAMFADMVWSGECTPNCVRGAATGSRSTGGSPSSFTPEREADAGHVEAGPTRTNRSRAKLGRRSVLAPGATGCVPTWAPVEGEMNVAIPRAALPITIVAPPAVVEPALTT